MCNITRKWYCPWLNRVSRRCVAAHIQKPYLLIVFWTAFQVLYLRKFHYLRTLNLSGNPFSEEANYKEYVIAHLPELVYLDFRLIDESAREAATERYKYSIEELVHDETIAKRKQDELEEKQQERQLHKVTVTNFCQ